MSEARKPLEGLRVVEMGSLLAGPFCGQLLGDFGAEVIKVEPPGKGDPMRVWGRHRKEGRTLWWPVIARNKKSVTLNLREEEGQRLARELIDTADVLVENFRPGTLERWGLGYEELSRTNPGLVMVRVSGFGQTGPYRDQAGFGAIGEAMGGIRHVTGFPDRPPPRTGISLGDSLAATFGALGALTALLSRERHGGRGQVVDIGIYEAVLALMEATIPEYALTGHTRGRTGTVLPFVAPSNIYPTSDNDYVLIAGNADTVFGRLAKATGHPEWAEDERFATHHARGENMEELDGMISAWTKERTSEEVLRTMAQAGVPSGKIFTAEDMMNDPHYRARENVVTLEDPEIGPVPMQNVVPKLSETPGGIERTGPALGEHNAEVYGDLLGISEEELDALRERGTV
ncbi:CaiB/BaiF CoA transferase family protein [Rubrobacter radiotolerans]|uniref:CoA transferase n=1 Tax=Rubrobacter radiotolerans TaxID=42256 RepID=A0AB35T3P1_RUBRA|nr:CoA transferase [Rubrobacter radiotolerans]MDX5894310.1 CoA transferase [Rubrobacter radiotolerans]SMC05700.1 succinyl-CoA:(R)-citramalate CoA-transferase [Rubrobacter radiotolerans DSM 5868]